MPEPMVTSTTTEPEFAAIVTAAAPAITALFQQVETLLQNAGQNPLFHTGLTAAKEALGSITSAATAATAAAGSSPAAS